MEHLKKIQIFIRGSCRHIHGHLPTKRKSGVTPLGLPLLLFLLYLFSGIISSILLLLSLLDLGYLSIWLVPPLSFVTLFSHAAFPFLARASRPEASPSYFSTLVVSVYVLAAGWFVAFVAALTVAAMKSRWKWNLQAVRESGGLATLGSQVAQIVLSCMEVVLLVTLAIRAHRQVIDRGEPETWRPPITSEGKESAGVSTVMFDSGQDNPDGDMKQISLVSPDG